MLFKMLGIERAWDAVRSDVSISRPRQVFVTQSRVLAEKVEEYYKKLTESHVAATRSTEESVLLGATKEKPEDRALVDQDEEELWHGSLPKRFSDLADEHFPLFVTFDHVRESNPFRVATNCHNTMSALPVARGRLPDNE